MEKTFLNEKLLKYSLPNGLDVMIIPKKDCIKKFAIFGTHFGSMNYKFKTGQDTEITVVPDGVAHFLEHKLFEQEDGVNALDRLTKMGANPNAYTSFNHTAYLFECTENFNEVFKALIQFVQNPYLTKENVEKEKGIIGQEIQMYDDDPSWQLFFDLLGAMYKNHAITKDIAGTIETIAEITPEILYKCYNTFYDSSNMAICVVGDVNPDEVLEIIKSDVKDNQLDSKIERFYDDESKDINQKEVMKKMDISMPMFAVGFKDNFIDGILDSGLTQKSLELATRDIAVQIALGIMFGKSNDFFQKLYDSGLIIKPLGYSYTFEEDYAYSVIEGESYKYRKVIDEIKKRIEEVKTNQLDKTEFENMKKSMYGDYVRMFNNVSVVATSFINNYFRGIDTSDYAEAFKNITIEDVEKVIQEHFDFDKMAVSIIESK
ncbi:MAG: insulinase family protein [Clostridia bacterium]|nr:insulinase family protein [Clostridia bacterium]